ncbi:hypothetical protein EAH74_00705 [Pseudomonas mandelii]|uniref:Uncharacterized protein n=1 Tax=Pseudomonas mandelii TaxID=75612 RepID=A0A502IJT0_9PSED|nr:hypothetical protein EAH74_00705 [Pseudomonas mandelii]
MFSGKAPRRVIARYDEERQRSMRTTDAAKIEQLSVRPDAPCAGDAKLRSLSPVKAHCGDQLLHCSDLSS